MAHKISFLDFNDFLLDEEEARDIIEMFFVWGDSKFIITTDEKEKRWRGYHQWFDMAREHKITLSKKNITRDFNDKARVGGNHVAPTLKVAAAMVLVHELQHANQVKLHKPIAGSSFYTEHHYWNRACEREARGYVDEKLNEICAYFGVPPVMRSGSRAAATDHDEVDAVVDLLSECEYVSMDDIKDELRISNVLNPSTVKHVRGELISRGVEIKKESSVYFQQNR
jgi:hypothetical protein